VVRQRLTDPGFRAGFAGLGDGPEAPDAFAGGGLVGIEEAAHAEVAAGDAGDDEVVDDEGGGGVADVAFVVDAFGDGPFPEELAGDAMDGEEVSVIGDEEDAVTEDSDTAVGALGGVTLGLAGHGALVVPEGAAGAGIEGEDLVGAGDVHDAVNDDGGDFEDVVVDGEDPLEDKVLDVGGVDLIEGGVAVAGEGAVIGGPVAGPGVGDVGERGSAFGGEGGAGWPTRGR
jgi:hypothetical protein